jgi:6-pyruvoyltetrahydropterin/6-carboxytetrahydropterin synthase
MRLTRKYRFSASHRLHASQLSARENQTLYGKCNNPFGHGHDYVLEVSVRGPVDEATGLLINTRVLDRLVGDIVLKQFDHANLNTQVEAFQTLVPTTENLASHIAGLLRGEWKTAFPLGAKLEKIRLRETGRNTFEFVLSEHELQ